MEKARLALIEDDPSHIDLVETWLAISSHEIIAKANTLSRALDLIDSIHEHAFKRIDAIILDGNLSLGAFMCNDAKVIYERYKLYGMTIPIIGYSNLYLCQNGIDIEERFDLRKNPKELLRLIDTEL